MLMIAEPPAVDSSITKSGDVVALHEDDVHLGLCRAERKLLLLEGKLTDLKRILNCHDSQLSAWFSGARQMSPVIRHRIADGLELTEKEVEEVIAERQAKQRQARELSSRLRTSLNRLGL